MSNKIMTRFRVIKTRLRLVFHEITARAPRDYGSCPTTFFRPFSSKRAKLERRLAVSLLLMMILGVTTVWGQKVNDGVYYIKNNNSGNWYLWPSVTINSKTLNQYLTTYNNTSATAGVYNDEEYYPAFDKTYSHWVVKNVDGGYIQLISPRLNKYVVIRDKSSYGDRDVWLVDESAVENIDYTYFVLNNDNEPYKISPKPGLNNVEETSGYSLNSAAGNDREWLTWTESNNNNYPRTGENRQGLIQFYNKGTPIWYFNLDLLTDPTISDVDEETNTFTITDANGLPAGYTIRYTTGDGTQEAPTATTGTEYSSPVSVDADWTIKAVVVRYGVVLTEVAEKEVLSLRAKPTISFDNSTKLVSISSRLSTGDIYYTLDGTEPDYEHYGEEGNTTLLYSDENKPVVSSPTTVKAIAVKNTMVTEMAIKTIVVNPIINVAIPDGGYTYDGAAKSPEVSVEFSGTTLDPNEYEVNYSDNTDAGTATVNIIGVADGNYIVSGSTTFTINRAPLTITANDQTITYGEAPAKSVEYSGFVGTETSDVLSGELEYICDYEQYDDVGLGSFTITLNGLTSGNYIITFVGGTLTVNPKEVGLDWGTTELTYTGSEQAPTATATETVNNDVINVTVTGGRTSVGSGYIATASALTGEKAGNYELPEANTIEFSIGKKPLTVTANDHTITYGDAPAANGVTCSGDFVPGDGESVLLGTVYYGYNYAQFGDVGTYNITPMGLTATNYDITFAPGTLTVNPKEVVLDWGTTALTYNGSEQAPTATATGTVNGDEIGVTVTGGQTDAGETVHTATASALTGAKAGNYKLPAANTKGFSIGKATLIITANDHTITYGDDPDDVDAGVTYTGFVGTDDSSVLGDAPVCACDYTQYGNVGSYDITPSGPTTLTNYDITYKKGTLTVTPKEVGIKWTNIALTYDGTSKVPTAKITSATDIVNDDDVDNDATVTVSGSALINGEAINPGYYKATASFTGDQKDNYKPVPSSMTFSISAKSIGGGDEPAEGIDFSLTEVNDEIKVTVKDGGTTLVLNEHYTVGTETQGVDTYITVTGIGKYGGSAWKLFVKPEFFKPTGASEYAAVYRASSDLSNPAGITPPMEITPYIVKNVNPSMGTINIAPVEYLPKNVPVLLLAYNVPDGTSNSKILGFTASSKPDNVTAITAQTENSNLLKVAPEGGVSVKDAQVYMFYKGEFVLAKKGKITEGKFYLDNPNYSATSHPAGSAGSRSVLRFVVGDSTGIVDVEKSEDSGTASGHDAWYLLDGRRLSGKPNKQGLYIWNGRKTVIKK